MLAGGNVTDRGLASLAGLTNLQTLSLHDAAEPIWLLADAARLEQVVQSNALRERIVGGADPSYCRPRIMC